MRVLKLPQNKFAYPIDNSYLWNITDNRQDDILLARGRNSVLVKIVSTPYKAAPKVSYSETKELKRIC